MNIRTNVRDMENSAASQHYDNCFILLHLQAVRGKVLFFYLSHLKYASLDKTHKKNSRQAFLLLYVSRNLDHSSVYTQIEESEGHTEKLIIIFHISYRLEYF